MMNSGDRNFYLSGAAGGTLQTFTCADGTIKLRIIGIPDQKSLTTIQISPIDIPSLLRQLARMDYGDEYGEQESSGEDVEVTTGS